MKRRGRRTVANIFLSAMMFCFIAIGASAQQGNLKTAQAGTRQRLARQVRNELQTLPYYSVFDWLEFEMQPGGVVVLRGQVTTPPDTKSTAEAYVKDVEGVTRVINNIEVLSRSARLFSAGTSRDSAR